MTKSCAVIGAGVIGAAVALNLHREGYAVTLMERERPAAGASFGNSGAIVAGSCAPTAMPGVWKEALRALVDPLAPFSLRLPHLPAAAPWLLRFLLASRRSRVAELAPLLHSLTRNAAVSWRALSRGTAIADRLHDSDWLKVYETKQAFDDTADGRALLTANGAPFEVLTGEEVRELEPALATSVTSGILQPGILRIDDPGRLVETMVAEFVAAGGRYEQADVEGIRLEGNSISLVIPGEDRHFDRAVIAAGAWSGPLAASLGDRVPLDAERGYHLMLPAGSERLLSRPVMNGDRFFVLSPMLRGMRMTSQSELAGVDAEPDYRRIRGLLGEAKRLLPELDATEETVWMGCRPSLPDSLPIIGHSSASPNILYAFGHQHLGMTLAAVTGELVADLVAGRSSTIDLQPFRANRF